MVISVRSSNTNGDTVLARTIEQKLNERAKSLSLMKAQPVPGTPALIPLLGLSLVLESSHGNHRQCEGSCGNNSA